MIPLFRRRFSRLHSTMFSMPPQREQCTVSNVGMAMNLGGELVEIGGVGDFCSEQGTGSLPPALPMMNVDKRPLRKREPLLAYATSDQGVAEQPRAIRPTHRVRLRSMEPKRPISRSMASLTPGAKVCGRTQASPSVGRSSASESHICWWVPTSVVLGLRRKSIVAITLSLITGEQIIDVSMLPPTDKKTGDQRAI